MFFWRKSAKSTEIGSIFRGATQFPVFPRYVGTQATVQEPPGAVTRPMTTSRDITGSRTPETTHAAPFVRDSATVWLDVLP